MGKYERLSDPRMRLIIADIDRKCGDHEGPMLISRARSDVVATRFDLGLTFTTL